MPSGLERLFLCQLTSQEPCRCSRNLQFGFPKFLLLFPVQKNNGTYRISVADHRCDHFLAKLRILHCDLAEFFALFFRKDLFSLGNYFS